MCGIAGIISYHNIDKNVIEKMTNAIIHRGPDGFGYWSDDGVVFGHRRLSIVDLSEAGHQPMVYMGRYVITYNGEIYNHIELRTELEAQGYRFQSHTDTEVIMAAYDFWGVDCLNRFNGMWAFVLYDKQSEKFFMARDRFGIKPFYYYKNKNTFVFASEIKALLEHPEVEKKANISFLQDYIQTGCKAYVADTSFEGIYRFDRASYFEGDTDDVLGGFEQTVFWKTKPNLVREKFCQKKANEYASQYYKLLEDAVRIRLRADVKVGSALSGGLDSSSIVYLVNKILKEQGKSELQETFSSVYKTKGTEDCDESYYIDMLAKALNVHSNQIEPKEEDVPRELAKVIYMMEDPPESTCLSAWYTFKLVGESDVTVTLDGQGADEQLAGYLPYITSYISSLPFYEMIQESKRCWSIPSVRKYLLRGLAMGLFRAVFGQRLLLFVVRKVLKKNFEPNLNQALDNSMNENLITLIHYADSNSMGHSVESRMPFMDYRLVEFLASVPACYKMYHGWTKYIARLAFDGKLPDEVCWRKDKMGWPTPEEKWFYGGLKPWYLDKITNSALLRELQVEQEAKEIFGKRENIVKSLRYLNLVCWYAAFVKKG